jgi:UDP-N-acetylglucosamine 2-epimerase (non-hydrolysing)
MKKIVLIIGARPNFMKGFPVYEALKNDFELTLIHTGQHFDEKMSKVFFEQLKFPYPDINFELEKKTKAGDLDDKLYVKNDEYLKNKDYVIEELINYDRDLGQLGEIRDKLKIEFERINPDLVIVFGDVTSTLAAGLAAKNLNIELAHVESGLRSGDLKMPEEVNRILTDHITKYYFVTEQSGVDNLKVIGVTENVYLVGNTMIDTQKRYLQQALNSKYHEKLGVKSREYVLITLHRPSNVDDLNRLKEIFDDFEELSKTEKLVYPIHPRTKNNLEKLGYLQKVQSNPNIILDEPLGYLEFTCLMANCKYVITDSGGLQEESTALDIPCFTLRENTERPCTLIENNGTNKLINKISEIELKECKGFMDLWDGKSSERIKMILQDPKIKYIYDSNRNMHLYVNNNSKKTIIFFSSSASKEKYQKFMINRKSFAIF